MKSLLKMLLLIVAVVVLPIVLAGAIIVGTDSYQYRQNQQLIERFPSNQRPDHTLVVFFSRSGNTEIMAHKIAELKQADVLSLQSKCNQIGVVGWLQAL